MSAVPRCDPLRAERCLLSPAVRGLQFTRYGSRHPHKRRACAHLRFFHFLAWSMDVGPDAGRSVASVARNARISPYIRLTVSGSLQRRRVLLRAPCSLSAHTLPRSTVHTPHRPRSDIDCAAPSSSSHPRSPLHTPRPTVTVLPGHSLTARQGHVSIAAAHAHPLCRQRPHHGTWP